MGVLTKVILGIAVMGAVSEGCTPLVKYQAEVGYYDGQDMKWFYGNMTTYKDCMNEAIWKFNDLNRGSDGRAFSWICLQWSGGNIIGKVR